LDARLKTLLTMKQVAQKGSMEFRRALQAHKELIKDHTRECARARARRRRCHANRRAARVGEGLGGHDRTSVATLCAHQPAPTSACADFDALPCELRGKDPHQRIRAAAKDTLDAMYDSNPATRE